MGTYPSEMKSANNRETSMPMFITALIMITNNIWNQSMCPRTNEPIKKMWDIKWSFSQP
jgi:hypothetical protein